MRPRLPRPAGLAVAGLISPFAAAAADAGKLIYPASGAPAGDLPAAGGIGSVTLFVALALAAARAWLFWRNRPVRAAGRSERLLSIDETRSLGNRQYLVVASYAGRKFLLGVCSGRIKLLAPLEGAPPRQAAAS